MKLKLYQKWKGSKPNKLNRDICKDISPLVKKLFIKYPKLQEFEWKAKF